MDVEEFRAFCLSFADTRDDFPFGKSASDYDRDILVFYEGIGPGWHMNKKHWISVRFDSDVPERLLRELIRRSYELAVAHLPKKRRSAAAEKE